MQFNIPVVGTKIRLTKDWKIKGGVADAVRTKMVIHPITIMTGSILSIYKLDIRSNSRTPKMIIFKIPKKGCPANPAIEGTHISAFLSDLENLEFELGDKAIKQLSEIELIFKTIKQEIK